MPVLSEGSHSEVPLCPTACAAGPQQTKNMSTDHAVTAYLVEDNPVIRDNLVAALEELVPMRILGSAASEADAVRWMDTPHPRCDVMIVDLFLNTGSGLGVLRALQSRNLSCRPVVLSNYVNTDMRNRCLALGALQVFDKSSDIDELVAWCAAIPPPEIAASAASAEDGAGIQHSSDIPNASAAEDAPGAIRATGVANAAGAAAVTE